MATNFPTSLDAFTNPVSSDTLDNPPHDQQHADVNDAMEAVQAKLGVGAHTIGEWTTFTPTFTNFTLGNGSVNARYCQINDIVFVWGAVTLGSTSVMGTDLKVNHPVGSSDGQQTLAEGVRFQDTGSGYRVGMVQRQQFDVRLYVVGVTGSYLNITNVTATVPFTWASTDLFSWSYWYRKV